MLNPHSTTIKNIEIRWGYLYSALATIIASGLLLAKTPPVFHPYVETLIGLVIAFHPSPIAITPQDVLNRLATFSATAEAIVPAVDKPYVDDAVAVVRSLEPLVEPKKTPIPPYTSTNTVPGATPVITPKGTQ